MNFLKLYLKNLVTLLKPILGVMLLLCFLFVSTRWFDPTIVLLAACVLVVFAIPLVEAINGNEME